MSWHAHIRDHAFGRWYGRMETACHHPWVIQGTVGAFILVLVLPVLVLIVAVLAAALVAGLVYFLLHTLARVLDWISGRTRRRDRTPRVHETVHPDAEGRINVRVIDRGEV